MLDYDDIRWTELEAGYRVAVDLRPFLRRLESEGTPAAWDDLWQELYHQGDVGIGSYAAVPHLVRIHEARGVVDWNTYALVATIELARETRTNPDVPAWLRQSYDEALRTLARLGLAELPRASEHEAVRSMLAVLAIVHGARTYGRVILEISEDELDAIAPDDRRSIST